MDFILMAALIFALLFIASIANIRKSEIRVKTDGTSSNEEYSRTNHFLEGTDESIIDEILSSKEISRIEIEHSPWRNRKYKSHSSKRLHEMHSKFMAAASTARISRNEDKAYNLMDKVGDINAELMIRRQIHIHRAGREPISINDPTDKKRLDYLLEEKLKNHQYKVQTDDGNYNFDYNSVINERLKCLQSKYNKLGHDENSSDLRAKCELLSIKLKSEPSPPLR